MEEITTLNKKQEKKLIIYKILLNSIILGMIVISFIIQHDYFLSIVFFVVGIIGNCIGITLEKRIYFTTIRFYDTYCELLNKRINVIVKYSEIKKIIEKNNVVVVQANNKLRLYKKYYDQKSEHSISEQIKLEIENRSGVRVEIKNRTDFI